MKTLRISFALFVLLLVGITLMSGILNRQETRAKLQDFQNKGVYLVSLMALYPIQDYETGRRDVLMRTISEYISSEGLLYFFVHDQKGKVLLSMASGDVFKRIPPEVQNASLYNMAMTKQQFKLGGNGEQICEFAKPIFDHGRKAGTIRLGLRPPVVAAFTMERLSLLAMMTFFVFSALVIGYYGICQVLKPLSALSRSFTGGKNQVADFGGETGSNELVPIIDGLEISLHKVREQLNRIKTDNLALASRIGVTTFEKNQIARMLDAISFGILVTDIHDNIVHINDYMLKILRVKPEEVIDRSLASVLRHREIISYVSEHDNAMQSMNPKPLETTLPDLVPGELFQVSLAYMMDDRQEPMGKMISVRNVTALRMAEESKHQFIAHVAHELRTPLTNIKAYSEMLMGGEVADREMQREFYNTINEETERLAHLIQNLLNISQMEVGSLTINKGLVRTDWFVEGCLSAIEASAQDKHLVIEKKMPDTFPSLMADKELLQGAIINILGNALKYTPENGKITFAIADHGDAVTFEVIDTGYGIAQEELPYIFEKFYRSGNPEIAKQTGSGLGLAITSEVVRLHGGEIDIKSQLGEGTHATIRIPKEEHYLGKE